VAFLFVFVQEEEMKAVILFESQNIRLAAINLDLDPGIMSAWTYDLEVARVFGTTLPHPIAAFEVKKYLEKRQKDGQENGGVFLFAIHDRQDDHLVGLIDIGHIMWNHGNTGLKVVFGSNQDRLRFGAEGLRLALQYIFNELNLFRATLLLPEYDQLGISQAEAEGFTLEVRMRQADYCSGLYWNRLIFGMLRSEYEKRQPAEVTA
jgi:RimJ/RimL family protein N-acetyltransferase